MFRVFMASILFAGAMVTVAFASRAAGGPTFNVAHRFAGPPADGSIATGGLIEDPQGNFWGTTQDGGTNQGACGPNGCGTVFKIAADGTYAVVYNFASASGANPVGGLVRDKKGSLWGTASSGGGYGWGVVFKITAKGVYSVVHDFANDGLDGIIPNAGLLQDAAGNFWGTTVAGGVLTGGTLFEIGANGSYEVIHGFGAAGDGLYPYSRLMQDNNGNILGTTGGGGTGAGCGIDGCGTIFEISAGGSYRLVHNFANDGIDGWYPYAGLMQDKKGNIWGTTVYGGMYNSGCGYAGCGGTVFHIAADGTYVIQHNFGGPGDTSYPFAALLQDKKGNLWGTTALGNSGNSTIFKISSKGKYSIAYTLMGNDGSNPEAALIEDRRGNLWGTAANTTANDGFGTVFEFTP